MERLEFFESVEDIREYLLRRFWGPDQALPGSVAVIGVSHLGISIIDALEKNRISVQGIFDDDPKKQKICVRGLPVQPVQNVIEVDLYN